ncbi:hypothetical protein AVEN_265863-1 [Araneus ventricosus]|uniref:Uncharacterized protein n=1 Tax=Araneus ventricosus TaxID=182803 RepID=A0A4Y2VFC5_ARAVE|nr:hypothetical protein AVEN_15352-1 [Araneus ventricosus]GBO23058.1 hypothetical protein AVEN_265863-1 [Araneus ventricosus]
MYISQYPPTGTGNSFCLVVKMLDSGPKGPRFKSTHCHNGDPEEHATPTLGVAPVVRHNILMYISQYPPPDRRNSLCAEVDTALCT